MEFLFAIVLTVVLLAAVVSVTVMALRQRRRRRRLAQQAHVAGLRFAPEDPFDVALRYRRFALMEAGHSPRAHNVTYGRLHGLPVRAFDFRYEVGHGTRRLTCHYAVTVAETERRLSSVLLWSSGDMQTAPLAVRHCRTCVGPWVCDEASGAGAKLASAVADFGADGGSIQACGGTVMLCRPGSRAKRGYITGIETIENVVRVLCEQADNQPSGSVEKEPGA
ncbi:MAG: hypothetical protein ACP5HU_08790 [Phycisphaerae bacterium]